MGCILFMYKSVWWWMTFGVGGLNEKFLSEFRFVPYCCTICSLNTINITIQVASVTCM
jgi:hypothetical protein